MMFSGAPRHRGRHDVAVRSTSHNRASHGAWLARKGIPKDVREAYKRAYRVSPLERFRGRGSLSPGAAKVEPRDWDATIMSRVEALRVGVRAGGLLIGRPMGWSTVRSVRGSP